MLDKITQQTFRDGEIVNGLLNLSRNSGTQFTSLNLNDLLGDTVTLLAHSVRPAHNPVKTNLEPPIAPPRRALSRARPQGAAKTSTNRSCASRAHVVDTGRPLCRIANA